MARTIEETYKKLSQREHVLQRSSMYIGDTKKHPSLVWVPDDNFKMEQRELNYSPGFMKIFDEILTNATDHAFRHDSVTQIKVDISPDTGEISVWNNGPGVPVEIHPEHNIYVPELIFSHLLSGSNYNDSDTRTGAGTNGIGSKGTNIFSSKFTVETVENKKKFVQVHSSNMTVKTKPKITSTSVKSYTKITFIPDYARFEMTGLESDAVLLIKKRVIDCIACTSGTVKVYLNGTVLKGKGMADYTKYYFEESKAISESQIVTNKGVDYIWEYSIVPYSTFEQVSFVNGNFTSQGGKHVDYILNQIVSKLKELIETKRKLKNIKTSFIKDKLFFFLRATVSNPTFSSQTKEHFISTVNSFGCGAITVSDAFITKLYKSSITDEIVELVKAKENASLSKTDGKKSNTVKVPKLEDALKAGTSKSNECTLILTEGLSAMTFALHGRAATSPDYIGSFPLRGKLINIKDATTLQLTNNVEICNIKKILGLKENTVYKNTDSLRYGKVLLLTDADLDGSHIKSLVINFIHSQFPSLLKLNFIQTLRTPIVKAFKNKKIFEFLNEQDYLKWKNTVNPSTFKIKYYKGLGTSSKEDAIDIFKRIPELKIDYYYKDSECDNAILLAFDKDKNNKTKKDTDSICSGDIKCSDRRKEWLSNYDRDIYIDASINKVSYQELIHKELIHFSIYDNLRSIPSICDGLKPSQRKILHYMLKNNITSSIKVAQLSGYVSAECGYHHGEDSLQGAIIGMAQNFTGSNNINLLVPEGNHGTRYLNGKDSASARYIHTYLCNITKSIFNANDTPLLNELDDDGTPIEPDWYLPIIPMILVNGCSGIGTGFSTNVPCYNPGDIIDNLRMLLEGKPLKKLEPWYRGFNGVIKEKTPGSYISQGHWKRMSDIQIKITELPIGTGITNYKEFLDSILDSKKILKEVKNKTRDEDTGICFIVEFRTKEILDQLINSCTLEKELKLNKSFSTNNMYLFNKNLILTKYNTPNNILTEFYTIRLEYYQKRKKYLVDKLQRELLVLEAKKRFVTEYINNELNIHSKSKDFIVQLLVKKGYPKQEDTFDYLLGMQVYSFTLERINTLQKQCTDKINDLDFIQTKTSKELWKIDLDSLAI